MREKGLRIIFFILVFVLIVMLSSCKNNSVKSESNEENENSETYSFDENGIVDFSNIEYSEDIEYLNTYYKALEGTVVKAHWKHYQWGINFGPSDFIVSGFMKVTDEEAEKIESQFTFADEEKTREEYWYNDLIIKILDFPKGISSEVTGCNDFNWSYSAEFDKWIAGGRWIGVAFYDVNNNVIYFYHGIK